MALDIFLSSHVIHFINWILSPNRGISHFVLVHFEMNIQCVWQLNFNEFHNHIENKWHAFWLDFLFLFIFRSVSFLSTENIPKRTDFQFHLAHPSTRKRTCLIYKFNPFLVQQMFGSSQNSNIHSHSTLTHKQTNTFGFALCCLSLSVLFFLMWNEFLI